MLDCGPPTKSSSTAYVYAGRRSVGPVDTPKVAGGRICAQPYQINLVGLSCAITRRDVTDNASREMHNANLPITSFLAERLDDLGKERVSPRPGWGEQPEPIDRTCSLGTFGPRQGPMTLRADSQMLAWLRCLARLERAY
jgi:hypothetical protein